VPTVVEAGLAGSGSTAADGSVDAGASPAGSAGSLLLIALGGALTAGAALRRRFGPLTRRR
jgi:hypothetical protein